MFTLKTRDPLFTCNNNERKQPYNENTIHPNNSIKSNQMNSQYYYTNRKKSHSHIHNIHYRLQHFHLLPFLFYLSDVTFIFTKLTSFLSIAWDAIAYGWVTTLIQPDPTNHKYYGDNHLYQKIHYYKHCNHNEFDPITNVFYNNKNRWTWSLKMKDSRGTMSDETSSSWGQFVDVDF